MPRLPRHDTHRCRCVRVLRPAPTPLPPVRRKLTTELAAHATTKVRTTPYSGRTLDRCVRSFAPCSRVEAVVANGS
eukprot:scaffold129188_cov66-Phaeocystis_antarctica.AAC.1